MSQPLTQDDETALFRKSWTLYDAITAENYMFHREIYALIAGVLRQRHAAGPYAVLDLGCGNARFMAPCFESAPPARYDGVDLSAAALEEARDYLRGLDKVTLHHTDMLQAVRAADTAFDVIFTGFAVHHLDAAEKQELFHACAAKLAPGGAFLMVDVVREEGQHREDYLHGYLGTMRTQWTAVHPEQLDEACAHVASFDFPEMLSDLTQMAANAGLTKTQLLQRHAQHHILQFSPLKERPAGAVCVSYPLCTSSMRPVLLTFAFISSATAVDMTHFEQRIRPLLIANCIECHGPDKQKGGLRLDSRAGWQNGGDSGPAIVPGKTDESPLWRAVTYVDRDLKMPPKRKLKDSEVADLKLWIESGAPDPRDEVASAEGKHKQPRADASFWSFQPPVAHPLPSVQDKAWPANDIDHFVLAKLEQGGLKPAPDADARVLTRRLFFDLTGLPPDGIKGKDVSYEKLVDELLQTDAFAERFASHWLDITRFAESSGGGRSLPFKDAWRFRDYVVESIRDNAPLNRMISEQLAGDLMPHENATQRRRQLTATGFLALGPTNYEEQDKGMLRMDIVDEQLDTMGRAFLGLTIGCARCHDHKFDPISARDYYALAGILRSTKTLKNYTDNVAHWIDTPLPLEGSAEPEMQAHEKQLTALTDQIAAIKDDLRDAGSAILRKRKSISITDLPGIVVDDSAAQKVGMWKQSTSYAPYIDTGYLSDNNDGKGEKTASFAPKLPKSGRYEVRVAYNGGTDRAERVSVTILHADGEDLKQVKMATENLKGLQFASLGTFRFEANGQGFVLISNAGSEGFVTVDAVQFIPADETVAAVDPTKESPEAQRLQEEMARLQKELRILQKKLPERPEAMSVADDTEPENAKIHIRGSTRNLGAAVPRGFIQAAMRPGTPAIPAESSGRLELAQWITSRENPLTARVMVNRVWHWLFGAGIVRTTDNFGSTGEAPSHPELLDHLAIKFIEDGWNLKRLVKEMVMSRTYRMASQHVHESDPDNRLIGRMNRKRLDAECIRDAMLAAAGTLDRAFGGPGVSDVKAIDANDQKIQNIEYGYQFLDTRRSIYTAAFRNVRHPLFEVFDFADINQPIAQRTTSTVATQALFLMNSPKVIEQARAAADVVLKSSAATDTRILTAFQRSLQREPTQDEAAQVREFIDASQSGNATAEDMRDVWARFIQTLWATPEFRFVE